MRALLPGAAEAVRCGRGTDSAVYAADLADVCSKLAGLFGPRTMSIESSAQVLDNVSGVPSAPIIHRHPRNPILTSEHMPYPSRLVYNAGVTKFRGKYVMVFRNDFGYDELLSKAPHFQLGLAYSDDGVDWEVQPEPILEPNDPEVMANY